MLRVVFFGNSEGVFSNRHFAALREAPCDVVGVVDVPPSKRSSTNSRGAISVHSFVTSAREREIPAFEPTRPNQPEFVRAVRDLEPDLFIAVGYMGRLGDELLAAPRLLPVNFHASLLPAYRGKHPLFWALRNGERWAGLTVHVMDSGLDTGDILYQIRVRTRRDDSVAALYDRIMERSLGLVSRLIVDAEAGKLRGTPQCEEGASYYSSVSVEDFRLDWRREAEQLHRWIRTSPGQCFSDMAGQRVYFTDAELVRDLTGVPGVLIRIGRTTCTIRCAAGRACPERSQTNALRLRRLRPDGANEQSAGEWCRERGLKAGDSLTG